MKRSSKSKPQEQDKPVPDGEQKFLKVPTVRAPAIRRLQVYALDPTLETSMDGIAYSRFILEIPWEGHSCKCESSAGAVTHASPAKDTLGLCCGSGPQVPELLPGPTGEYVEVIDVDPSSDCLYPPVDLNNPLLLSTNGLTPTIGNPQFHQQMVYAVAMKTIANFERVLGRRILWSERDRDAQGAFLDPSERYVQRLRIYPHALREQNAYYSPVKKALLFGYFNATTVDPRQELPGGVIFTCLSHDIVAHETTHAILDGLHRRLMDASNQDMLAFHEAFADIIAIFQHFTMESMLHEQIQQTRGNLRQNNQLAQLAAQFGRATNRGGALRNALSFADDGTPLLPDPNLIDETFEPHERGAILVAAVFDAFLKVYEHRVADLYRIATNGTGVLPEGHIHPDLARRLAEAASKTAQRVLDLCIRSVDYLPPVDVTFGDFLRALITADAELFPDDPRRIRVAFIDAFRQRGIYAHDVKAMGEDSLKWTPYCDRDTRGLEDILPPRHLLRAMAHAFDEIPFDTTLLTRLKEQQENLDRICNEPQLDASKFSELDRLLNDEANQLFTELTNQAKRDDQDIRRDREERDVRRQTFSRSRRYAIFFRNWLLLQAIKRLNGPNANEFRNSLREQFGLDADGMCLPKSKRGVAKLEVHAVRPAYRRWPNGRTKVVLMVMLTQSKRVPVRDDDDNEITNDRDEPLQMKVRGGCTLLIDPDTGCVEYAISKGLPSETEVDENTSARLQRQMEFVRSQLSEDRPGAISRFGLTRDAARNRNVAEPFAFVHRHHADHAEY